MLAAAAMVTGAFKLRLPSRARVEAIQPLCTVRHGARELPYRGPECGGCKGLPYTAARPNVRAQVLPELAVREDLVLVGVEERIIRTRACGHEIIPVGDGLEGIVNADPRVASPANRVVPIPVVALDPAHIQLRPQWLVDKLNRRHRGRIRRRRVPRCNDLHGLQRVTHIRPLLPLQLAPPATVVEAVLAAGGSMQVHPDLDAVLLCPADGSRQVVARARDKRIRRQRDEGPVSNWYSYVIDPNRRQVREILGRDEGAPVGRQLRLRFRRTQLLTKRSLVDGRVGLSCELLE